MKDLLWDPDFPTWLEGINLLGSNEFTPIININEDDDKVIITAELPGLDSKDIDITISGRQLIIKGEKRQENEQNEEDYLVKERYFGNFKRVLYIPSSAENDKAKAEFKNGVLKISLPKKKEFKEQIKKLEISA